MKKIYLIIILVLLCGLVSYLFFSKKAIAPILLINNLDNKSVNTNITNNIVNPVSLGSVNSIVLPINNALARVTKKPFGIKVSPQDSPVSPEKFSGYHTGTDFETTALEKDIDVPILAICEGPIILRKIVTGYGGVVVQSCKINSQDVTVVYGHLRLPSVVMNKTNPVLKAGEQIALLGTGYSSETDGERKHLHLSIHKGKSINILGYVQKQTDLDNWFDFMTLVK